MIDRDEVLQAIDEAIDVQCDLGDRLYKLRALAKEENDLKLLAALDVGLHTAYGLLDPINGDKQC